MSTPCKIIVKIDKGDINVAMRFDNTWPLNPIPYGEWIDRDREGHVYINEFSNTSVCQDVRLKGDYIGIYCHWDGDTQTTGKILKKYFKTYEKALNLVLGGDISSLSLGVLKNYANRKGADWKGIKPVQGTLEDIRKKKFSYYEHVFEEGKWRCRKVK